MTKKPRLSPGYLRAVQRDTEDWLRTHRINTVRARDEAARKAEEAERAAVFADLDRNKRGEP